MLPSSENFEDITSEISQCSSECSLNELLERSELFRPNPSMKEVLLSVLKLTMLYEKINITKMQLHKMLHWIFWGLDVEKILPVF